MPTILKIVLPAAAAVYWLSPIDLMPGLPFDDIALMILALKMFVQLAPDAAKQPAGGSSSAKSLHRQKQLRRRHGRRHHMDRS